MELTPAIALLMGLTGSLHCFGMCGSIASVLALSLPVEVKNKPITRLLFLLEYSAGRLLSYSVSGLIAGWLGFQAVSWLSPESAYRVLQISASLMLILFGLYLANWIPWLSKIEKLGKPLWARLEPIGRHLLPVKSHYQAWGYGAIWGWLPCGLVYATLIMASVAGSAKQGAITMLAFGIGTLPAILASGLFAHQLQQWAKNRQLRQFAGSLLIMLAIIALFFTEYLHHFSPTHNM